MLTAKDGSSFKFKAETTSKIVSFSLSLPHGISITTFAKYRTCPCSPLKVDGNWRGKDTLNGYTCSPTSNCDSPLKKYMD